jgi:hypothetical protein
MKDFREDISNIYKRLKEKKPFAFSKYADGEYKILVNEPITNCDNWTFCPETHKAEQSLLLESFKYTHPDYVVGISCPCCQPVEHVDWMKKTARAKNLTWANLFVNSNYDFFTREIIPLFSSWDKEVFLFANEEGLGKDLPFNVTKYFPLNMKAWQEPFLSHWIEIGEKRAKNTEGALFLFSGGPLGNILSYKLHQANPLNTYIDIGSTISPWIVGSNRDYHHGGASRNQKCTWSQKADLDFSVFKGGWSYMAEEMNNAVSLLPKQKSLDVMEFGCGDSSIKLFNLLNNKWDVRYEAFESNSNYIIDNSKINCTHYNEAEIESLDIGNKKYDFILIDGPNGVLRKHWYSKITNNVKRGTIILIDDWCHFEEFEEALVNDFGSKIKYEVIETRKEFDINSAPHLGYKSWKIVKVL